MASEYSQSSMAINIPVWVSLSFAIFVLCASLSMLLCVPVALGGGKVPRNVSSKTIWNQLYTW